MAISAEAGGLSGHYSASFFEKARAVVTLWTEVEFVDRLDQNFLAGHIKITEITGFAVEISFDHRTVNKQVHGFIEGNDTIQLDFKHARSVFIRRAEGADTEVDVWAWR